MSAWADSDASLRSERNRRRHGSTGYQHRCPATPLTPVSATVEGATSDAGAITTTSTTTFTTTSTTTSTTTVKGCTT